MTANVASLSLSKSQQLIQYVAKKLWSIPGIALLAFIGLLMGMCIYFGALETNASVTAVYHSLPMSDGWRHLVFRSYPETTFAAWFAQCAALVAIVGGVIKKHYRVYKTHELFWRPVVGLVFTIPGAAAMAGAIWVWDKFNVGAKLHTNHLVAGALSSHPGVWDQFQQSVILDADKKLMVITGSFIFGLWWMKPYFQNVQGWLAEHSVISTNARNQSRYHRGLTQVGYTRPWHHILPGFRDKVRFVAEHLGDYVPDAKGTVREVTLNAQNHRPVNNFIYRAFQVVTVAGIAGGLYIMFFIAQGTHLAISVVH